MEANWEKTLEAALVALDQRDQRVSQQMLLRWGKRQQRIKDWQCISEPALAALGKNLERH